MPDIQPEKTTNNSLKALSLVAFKFSFVYSLLFVLFLPFHQPLLPNTGAWLSPLITPIIHWIGKTMLGMRGLWTVRLESDSAGLYIFSVLLAFISVNIVFVWTFFEKNKNGYKSLRYWFRAGLSYFLAMHLLGYGFNKIFKVQFFLPEPNTLYTPAGQLSQDILFWTSMGSSYPYTVFSGIVELLPACLLLFRRTRLSGAIISFGVMSNVLMLNFGFDISVKLFSAFLLFVSWLIISPHFIQLYRFFILQQSSQIKDGQTRFTKKADMRVYFLSKSLIIALLLFNGLLPYLRTGVYNDDLAPRPYLHGAYEVQNFVLNGDTLPALASDKIRWHRVFVHRRGYFIIQNMQDKMKDFSLLIDKAHQRFLLTDYDSLQYSFEFRFSESDSLLVLRGVWKNNLIEINARQLNISKLPLLNPNFHWTVDELRKKD